MRKNRICTTISARHWGLLRKHLEKFMTQQKVLEAALEKLEESSSRDSELRSDEKLWNDMGKELRHNLCIIHKDVIKEVFKSGGFERMAKKSAEMNLMEFQVIFSCKKPLKECNLMEIMEGIVQSYRLVNIFDTIEYEDLGNYYLLIIFYNLDIGTCTMNIMSGFEKLFRKCGVKTESELSENHFFMKIYKN